MTAIEPISSGDTLLAFVIGARATSDTTSFITGDDANFQAGFVVYPAGGEVIPHVHLPVRREVVGTAEMLFVRSGRCLVDIYDTDRNLVATRELGPGDGVLTLSGGHGFRMIEATTLFEIKQGPFMGGTEKVRFQRPDEISEQP